MSILQGRGQLLYIGIDNLVREFGPLRMAITQRPSISIGHREIGKAVTAHIKVEDRYDMGMVQTHSTYLIEKCTEFVGPRERNVQQFQCRRGVLLEVFSQINGAKGTMAE